MNSGLHLAPKGTNTRYRVQILNDSDCRHWPGRHIFIIGGALCGHFGGCLSWWFRRPNGGGAGKSAHRRQAGIKRKQMLGGKAMPAAFWYNFFQRVAYCWRIPLRQNCQIVGGDCVTH